TDDGDELAVGHLERGALHRRIGGAVGEPERDGDVAQADGWRSAVWRGRRGEFRHRLSRRLTVPDCAEGSAPNPKFAQPCCKFDLRTSGSKGALDHMLASVPLIPKFASECAARFCELRNRDTSL